MIEMDKSISYGREVFEGASLCAKYGQNIDIAIHPCGKENFSLTINGKTIFVGKRYEVFDKLKEILG